MAKQIDGQAEARFKRASDFPAAAARSIPGATICETPESIERFRMITILQALKLESNGIKVYRRGGALTAARKLYGVKAKNATMAYVRLKEEMMKRGIIVHDAGAGVSDEKG